MSLVLPGKGVDKRDSGKGSKCFSVSAAYDASMLWKHLLDLLKWGWEVKGGLFSLFILHKSTWQMRFAF